tara:strand:- start:3507 stop:4922 length:1416 start_codon:yes stop_codon:yes gene_type:complete
LNIVKKNKFIILILIITLIGTVLRFQDFNNGFWWDEWTTLWFSNINFNFSDQEYWNYLSYEVHADTGSSEPTPKIVFFIMQCYFKIFGYSAENAKIFVLTSGILFCLFSYYLSYLVLNNKKLALLFFFLISTNLFLIWVSQSFRSHIFVSLVAIIQIIIFFKFFDSKNYYTKTLYVLASILSLSVNPLNGMILVSQFLYFIFVKKKIKTIFLLNVLIFIIYVCLNFNYLLDQLNYTTHHATFSKSFFIGYFFNVYFASIILGGLHLLLIIFLLFKNYKKVIGKEKILFVSICVPVTYLLLIMYSFRNGIMSPKYILYVVPLIIIWIIYYIDITKIDFKFKLSLYVILIFGNLIVVNQNYNDRPIKRPPIQKTLTLINKSSTKIITSNKGKLFDNYIQSLRNFKKYNLSFLELETIKNEDDLESVWLICRNSPRAETKIYTETSCEDHFLNSKFKNKNVFKLPDIQLTLYKN